MKGFSIVQSLKNLLICTAAAAKVGRALLTASMGDAAWKGDEHATAMQACNVRNLAVFLGTLEQVRSFSYQAGPFWGSGVASKQRCKDSFLTDDRDWFTEFRLASELRRNNTSTHHPSHATYSNFKSDDGPTSSSKVYSCLSRTLSSKPTKPVLATFDSAKLFAATIGTAVFTYFS